MTSYTNALTGQTINPSSISYQSLSLTANTLLQWPINGNTGSSVSTIIDVAATANASSPAIGWLLELPPASQVSTGQSVLVRNTGSNVFTVADSSGNTIVTAASGVAYFVYLTDNATSNGTWATVTFGAGTSAANASTLAGYGLTAVGTTLNQTYAYISYFSSATLPLSSQARFIVYSGGAGAFTLPSSSTAGANWFTIIKNNGTGVLTLTPSGADTIDGNANQQLQLTESLVIVSNGTGWNTFAYGRSNSFAYTQYSAAVTGGTTTLTSAQAANTIQTFTGVLTSNFILVVPQTVQFYSITNRTTGSYTFTVKTSYVGARTAVIPTSTSLTLVCDGTNVDNATSGTASLSSATTLLLANGSASSPSLSFSNDSTSGFYLAASNQVGVAVAGVQIGYFGTAGLTLTTAVAGTSGTFTTGISGGTF